MFDVSRLRDDDSMVSHAERSECAAGAASRRRISIALRHLPGGEEISEEEVRKPPGPPVGRPPDMAPASVLGLRHPHGTKMRYLAGCRCLSCRRGNRDYERKLQRDRKLYGPNDLVSPERVLAHLRYLKTFGMGHKTVARHARVSKTSLAEIIWYGRKHIRRRSEARILAIQPTLETLPRNTNIPAAETVAKVHQLLKWGYTRRLISRDALGNASMAFQMGCVNGKTTATPVKKALAIRDFYELVLAMRRAWGEKRIRQRHYVYWKRERGRRPEIPTRDKLELRPFAVTYELNVMPIALKRVVNIRSAIRRQIGKMEREAANAGSEHVGQSAGRVV